MLKCVLRAWLAGLAMLFALISSVPMSPALAQSRSWTPTFDSSQHVYVDPQLKNHPTHPIGLSGVERKLPGVSAPHKLQVFVIATEAAFDPDREKPAIPLVNDLVSRWQGQAAFPKDDFLVIVWVRNEQNKNRGSVAAYGGNRLHAYGYDSNRMSDRNNGPVTPALKKFMPADPESALLEIVRNVNSGIDRHIADAARAERDREAAKIRAEQERIQAERDRVAAEQSARERAEEMAAFWAVAWKVGSGIAFLGVLLSLFLYRRRWQKKAQALLTQWETQVQNAGHWYVQLEESHFGFLKQQDDWQQRFKGETLKQFKVAVKGYADLTVRKLAASKLFDDAKAAFNKSIFIGGYQRAIALLSTETVIVSGRQLSIEEADLFGGLVEETSYKPDELLSEMEALFQKTNKELGAIKAAFQGAAQNKKDIEGLLARIEQLKASLTEKALSFDPYAPRLDKIRGELEDCLALVNTDPLTAFGGTEKVEAACEALKADIESAISIKDSLQGNQREIDAVKAKVAKIRGTAVDYSYPEPQGAPSGLAEKFLLNEQNGNPDALISSAETHLKHAHQAVLEGKLDLSTKKKKAATEAAAQAGSLVDAVLDAVAFIKKWVPAVRENLASLQAEIPGATTAVEELKADFLAKNFVGEPKKLETGIKVSESTEAELAKVRKAFFEQRFLASRAHLENVGNDIQGSRDQFVEIHTRLKQLRGLRAHSKQVAATSQELANALKTKLKTHEFTTARATDDSYAQLLPVLSAQVADVAKDVTDWPAAAEAADKLLASFKGVDSAIDNERKAHELAVQRVEAVRAAVGNAKGVVDHDDVRRNAHNKYDEAVAALREVESNIKVAKSDWAAIARKAEGKAKVAEEAKGLAEKDKALAREARSLIQNADSEISRIEVRSWVQTASWGGYSRVISLMGILDLSSAKSALRQAQQAMSSRDYEGARENARRAESYADNAESKANAALAAAVAEQISQWQAEERRKEEEERRRRQEEERREEERREQQRRDDDNRRSSGGDNYGGGSSGGGGGNYSGGGGGDNY